MKISSLFLITLNLILAMTLRTASASETPLKKSHTHEEAFVKGLIFGAAQYATCIALSRLGGNYPKSNENTNSLTGKINNLFDNLEKEFNNTNKGGINLITSKNEINNLIVNSTTVIFDAAVVTNNDSATASMYMLGEAAGLIAANSLHNSAEAKKPMLSIPSTAIIPLSGAALWAIPAIMRGTLRFLGLSQDKNVQVLSTDKL